MSLETVKKHPTGFSKNRIPWNKGLIGYGKGHSVSAETRAKISAALKKSNPKTPTNQLLRKSSAMKDWRLAVFKRDNFKCQECGFTKDLHPHHIKPFAKYPELRFDIDNGVTLCSLCHGKKHNMTFSKLGRWLKCKICNIPFKPKSGHLGQRTCSKKCGYKLRGQQPSKKLGKHYPHLRRAQIRNCEECNNEFRAVQDYKNKKQKFCSPACYLKYRWGYTEQDRSNSSRLILF